MIVVKFEVWPGGEADRAFEISRIGITNVTGAHSHADYEITALLARDKDEEVLKTEVRSHPREAGVLPLARRVMTNLCLRDELTDPASYDDPTAEFLRRGDRVGRQGRTEPGVHHQGGDAVDHTVS